MLSELSRVEKSQPAKFDRDKVVAIRDIRAYCEKDDYFGATGDSGLVTVVIANNKCGREVDQEW